MKIGIKMVMNVYDLVANRFEKALKEAADMLAGNGYKGAKEISEKILLGNVSTIRGEIL